VLTGLGARRGEIKDGLFVVEGVQLQIQPLMHGTRHETKIHDIRTPS